VSSVGAVPARVLAGAASVLFVLATAVLAARAALADLIVPGGSLISVGSGVIDLACTELVVSSTSA